MRERSTSWTGEGEEGGGLEAVSSLFLGKKDTRLAVVDWSGSLGECDWLWADFPIVDSISSFFRVCSGEIIGNNFFLIFPFFFRVYRAE